tara:strand:+ start:484 stop:660 length:177 start_codon:yes stop_codon:yes gene_type:complete
MNLLQRLGMLVEQWEARVVQLDQMVEATEDTYTMARLIGKVSTARAMLIELKRELKDE